MVGKRRRIGVVVAGVVGAAALAAVSIGHGGDEPPAGLSAGVSALEQTSPVQGPAGPDVKTFARVNAKALGTTVPEIMTRLHLLRRALGKHDRDLYAFQINGAVCFVLSGEGGTCSRESGSSSFTWTLGGGDGITDAGALVGVAADDVTRITLNVDGTSIPVSLVNNGAYADLPLGGSIAVITVSHRDGKQTSDTVRLTG